MLEEKVVKIKVFTHTDLDGVSSFFEICEKYKRMGYTLDDINVTFVNHKEIDKKIINFLNEADLSVLEKLYITDITFQDIEVGHILEEKLGSNRLELVDHHNTAKHLMDTFDWCYIADKHSDGRLSCATSLLAERFGLLDDKLNAEYVELVRLYDTWDWEKEGKVEAKDLNDFMYLIGRKDFVYRYRTGGIRVSFSAREKYCLELEKTRVQKYVEGVAKTLVKTNFLDYRIGYVFNEQYGSSLGNYIVSHEDNNDIDFVVMINMCAKRVSFVTKRDDIDLGTQVASLFGGGGHPKASGCSFSLDFDKGEYFDLLKKSIFNI